MLKGKVAIVTGAARGIGRAISELFAANGAKVYALDVRADGLAWASANPLISPVVVDLRDFPCVKGEVLKIKKAEGHIDILMNNAGLVSYEMISMIDFDKFRKMIDVNVVALVYLLQLVARIMQRQNSGSIVNMSSMVGEKGAKGQLSYSATKGAVSSITKSAAKELAEYHIRVNAIAPAMVGTDRFKAELESRFADKIKDIPFGRLAEPREIAQAALFLASDNSGYITGQILGVDGACIM